MRARWTVIILSIFVASGSFAADFDSSDEQGSPSASSSSRHLKNFAAVAIVANDRDGTFNSWMTQNSVEPLLQSYGSSFLYVTKQPGDKPDYMPVLEEAAKAYYQKHPDELMKLEPEKRTNLDELRFFYGNDHADLYDQLDFYQHDPHYVARQKAALSKIIDLLKSHDGVDFFILSHANTFSALLAKIPPDLRRKIRLVYDTGCKDAKDSKTWMDLGIGSYVGHPGTSCSPVFWQFFRAFWSKGYDLKNAVDLANAKLESEILHGIAGGVCARMISDTRAAVLENTRAELFGNPYLTIVTDPQYLQRAHQGASVSSSTAASAR